MADDTEKPSLVRIAELLHRHQVEFMVIGGQAAALHGSPIPTYDVDLCYRRSAENLERLANAVRVIKPILRGARPDLPFQLDAKSLALGSSFTFDTSLGPLDLLGWVEPLGTYDDVVSHSETIDLDDIPLQVLSLDDLIAVKRHIARPKDQADLVQLLAIKRLRDESDQS